MKQTFKVTFKNDFNVYREVVFPNYAQLCGCLYALVEFGVTDVKIEVL